MIVSGYDEITVFLNKKSEVGGLPREMRGTSYLTGSEVSIS